MKNLLSPFRLVVLSAILLNAPPLHAQCVRTVNVSSSSALATAVANAQPGDCIVLANGSYAGFTITKSGTAANPITISAANQGQAIINSGMVRLSKVANVTLSGLSITTSGSAQTVDAESYRVGIWLEAAAFCRVTRCSLNLQGQPSATQWIMLSGNSETNRIDHNDFGPNTVHGSHLVWPRGARDIPGVTPPSDRTQWALGNGPVNPNMARYTQIDHNYFHGQASGSAETIVTGAIGVTGDYQNTFTLIEWNLFQDCDGDPEAVSVKSSSNTLRYNTVRSSSGVFSLRSGNNSFIYGNFFICGGSGGGVKINERNHTVYNNYIENSDTSQYPIMLEDGDPYGGGSFTHAQVVNARIVHNTMVNPGRPFQVGHGGGTLHPDQCVIANNIIKGSGTLYSEDNPTSLTRSQNIISTDPGKSGFIVTDPQFTTVNGLQKLSSGSPAVDAANQSFYSFVTDDMDGQPRGTRDIGADEVSGATITRKPLTTADVGPNSPGDGGTGDFTIAASPSSQAVNAGSSATYTVTITASGGFAGTVALSASGLPSGASASFSPATITGSGSATMTLSTSASTPAATSTITVTGASSGLSHSATVSLAVMNFTIALSPSSQTVAAGGNTSYTVTIGSQNGFSGTVNLSASSLASGVTGSFNPTSIAGAGSSTLTLTTSASTPASADTFTVAGTSGSLSHSVNGTLNVTNPNGEIAFEAENLAFTTNGAVAAATQIDTNASNGQWVLFNSDSAGDWIQFTLPNVPAGTYSLKMDFKKNNNRAILQLSVDGANVGATVDQFASPSVYTSAVFGNVTFSTTGNHTVRLTVSSKNASSSGFTMAADKFTLTPTNSPPPTVTVEAESMPVTSSGATTSTASDANASGGVWLALNATNAGPFMDLTTPSLPAGTYQLQFTYKSNTSRGQHTVSVDGTQVGGTVDQYATTQTFPTVTLGNVTFGAAGTHTVRLTVTGKNASSSSFILSADKFTFVGQ